MKKTKKQKKEVMAIYEAYWDSYLKGDIKTMASFVDDSFKVIGSTDGEVFFGKNETMKFYKTTADQIAGKAEFRNRTIKEEPVNGLILITELCDLYILIEKAWVFYSKVRVSSLLEKKADGWKFIQQHGSIPDSRTQQGEQVAFEKIKKENLELREAVKRRTIALEQKNRELEIETSLERVRAKTMAMQKSEELKEVIQVVYEQFVHLNINIEHTGFIMDYNVRDDMHIWLADQNGAPSEITIPYFDSPHWNSFIEAKEKGLDFFANQLPFKEKNRFYKKLFKFIPGLPEEAKEFYLGCPGLAISTVLLENVGLYIENFSGIPYSDEENNTLMRFGKVFQQTYTRFHDLQKAEAQAREAQIEMALERVRSRAMAMQKSDELAETAYVLYEQFGLLGENPEQLTIGIIDETLKIWEFWLTLGGNQINHVFKASIDEPTVLNKSYTAWKERKKSIVIDISGDELKAYYNFFKNLPGYKEFNDFKNSQKPEHRRVINMAFFSNGSLSLSSPEPKPAETIQLLERFAGVLEQTYTRFLDLQIAEAQAREAQIEAALERVRSKAMAMHKSDDLTDAVTTVFSELDWLGFKTARCGIGIFNDHSSKVNVWTTSSNDSSDSVHLSGDEMLEGHPLLEGIYNAWLTQTDYSYVLKGNDLINYYKVAADSNLPVQAPGRLPEKAVQYYHCVMFPAGGLFAFSEEEFSNDVIQLMKRFSDVFHLTFTRHLDLHEAEAQAREAKIEAALERVRSKAMAMHNSEDLAITVDVFFKELKNLKVTPRRCGVTLINEKTHVADLTVTTANNKGDDLKLIAQLKLAGHPVLDKVYDCWKQQKEYHPVLHGEEIKEYYQVMNPQVNYPDFPDDVIQYGHYFFFEEGGVFAWTDKELSENDLKIFRRFTSVLSLTYRRYIDLKNAEMQNIIIQAENERKTQELEEARQMQLAMLPKEIPDLPGLEIAVYMKTATEVGGDYYDFSVKEDGTFNICLGDATGHGMKAGIMVSSMKSIFTTNAAKMDIENFFVAANSGIKSMNLRRMMMGLIMLNINKNSFKLINAGMPPVFLFKNTNKRLAEMKEHGMPIGAMNQSTYHVSAGYLEKGDVLLLISDGLPELQNPKNEMYGFQRIQKNFKMVAEKGSQEIVDHLKNKASLWINEKDPDDDVTLVVIKVK